MKSNDEQFETEQDNPIDAIDRKIALRLIDQPAVTDQQLASELGISRQSVNRHRRGAGVQNILKEALDIQEDEIRRLVQKSLARLEELLDSDDQRLRLAAASVFARLANSLMTRRPMDFGRMRF